MLSSGDQQVSGIYQELNPSGPDVMGPGEFA
jgi:hypothetical protein